ncbi:MAG: T9SS type A sorting domain-containing protein, partial [Ignavibacteria bacterium]
ISYALPKASSVKLVVYDMLGREVKTLVNEYKQAGSYNVSFDASSLASGVYFYRIYAGDFTNVKKMMLIK